MNVKRFKKRKKGNENQTSATLFDRKTGFVSYFAGLSYIFVIFI